MVWGIIACRTCRTIIVKKKKEVSVHETPLFHLILCFGSSKLLLDAGLLACELAQVVKLCTAHLTTLVDLDAVDVGRLDGEDTLDTHGARHLADGDALLISMTRDADNHTTVELDTLLVTLDDLVGYSDGVTRMELVEFLASSLCLLGIVSCKCLFSNLD